MTISCETGLRDPERCSNTGLYAFSHSSNRHPLQQNFSSSNCDVQNNWMKTGENGKILFKQDVGLATSTLPRCIVFGHVRVVCFNCQKYFFHFGHIFTLFWRNLAFLGFKCRLRSAEIFIVTIRLEWSQMA